MSDFQNILSFDIEDWFHPEIFNGTFSRKDWRRLESRVKKETEIIYNFLSRRRLKATLFFLGWVAEQFPELVREAVAEGHEIASHGYAHAMITHLTPEDFRTDLRKSLTILNELADEPVVGYRAPTFSITRASMWALPIMLEEGIRYDSSVFPIHHDRYGIPDAPREAYILYEHDGRKIVEYPMTTVKWSRWNVPCSGGGYFRLLPFSVTLRLMKRCQRERRPIIFYAHPWEFDTELPRIDLGRIGTLRHYQGIGKFLERLERITEMFPFTSFRDARIETRDAA